MPKEEFSQSSGREMKFQQAQKEQPVAKEEKLLFVAKGDISEFHWEHLESS